MKHPRDAWNRCDKCGRFIKVSTFEIGAAAEFISTNKPGFASRVMVTPDSELSTETWETLCRPCAKFERWVLKHSIGPKAQP